MKQQAHRPSASRTSLKRAAKTAAAAAITGLAVVPVALLCLASFARGWYWPALVPRESSLRAWMYIWLPSAEIIQALLTSILIAVTVTVLAVVIALPAARALALHEFTGKRLIIFVLLLPVFAPSLAAAMGVHALFLRYGLTDSVLGVVLVHLVPSVPYATLMLTGSFANFDTDYEAQARTLGGSPAKVWRYVTLPAIAPGLAVAAAFAFIISWSQYLTTLFIGGGRIVTLPLTLVSFQRSGDEAIAAALSIVFLVPPLLVFLIVAKFLRND